VDATAYYAIGIPLYIVLFGVEAAITHARHQPAPSFAGSVSNIGTGLGAIVVGMIVGPLLVALYDWSVHAVGLIEWTSWWLPFFVALVLGDLCNYWRHRLEHRWAALWAVHNVHHTPSEMNLSVGMRHAWLSDTYAFPFYAALPLLGIPTAQFFLAMVVLTLYALFTHSRAYDFPSLGILVTPRTHAVHHARNARYVDKNFAAMFVVWDHLFGTFAALDPAEPPVFGTPRGSETYDGALAQWVGIGELGRRVRATRGLPGKLRALVASPAAEPVVEARRAPLSRATRAYVIVQLALLIAFSAYVYGMPANVWALGGGVLIVAAIAGLGGVLDQRRGARSFEAVRLAVFVPAAILIVGATW
jgi:sterol desaturase/sphingolipid hydroxylase (fatty acid hydroxylase superfamily)